MKSIQTKLTSIVLAIFFVSLSLLGGLNYWRARTIITEAIVSGMEKQAESSVSDLKSWLEARKAELLMLSASPVFRSGDVNQIVPELSSAVKLSGLYVSIGFTDPSGACINSMGARANLADRDYFKRAMSGKVTISNPMVTRTTGRTAIVIAVPVQADGKIIGCLSGTVELGSFAEKVLSIKAGTNGYGYVMQSDGLTIVHPDQDVAMKYNGLTDPKVSSAQKALDQRIASLEKGWFEYNSDGVEKIVAFAPIPEVDWALAIVVPKAEVTGTLSTLTVISLITIVIILLIAAWIIFWFARRLTKPIKVLNTAVDRIASGDLSVAKLDITSNDEIGHLARGFEQMAHSLRELIQKISGVTDRVTASSEELTASSEQSALAANQIATSINDVAQGTAEQMNAANEAASVVEQMSAGIEQAAANANQVAYQSAQAADKASQGGKTVDKAVGQMGQIEETVSRSAYVVTKLGDKSMKIGEIVDTISGIAGQTNLLALNAAIEAARAGEQGRGFAVVAEEVRKLAEQSQGAATKIAEMIGEIQGDIGEAVSAMTAGTKDVKTGAEVVNDAGQTFGEIVELVSHVSNQVKDISETIQQIASGSQHIVGSVKRITELSKTSAGEAQTVSAATEEQLASMEEISSSSQALEELARDLQAAAAKFRL